MKKIINDPRNVVRDALYGVAAAHPQLRVDHAQRVVVRGDAPRPGKVGLVSGGGSGHEPLHAGFVGRGMLDAACAGEVFTSPVPDQILAATKAVNGGAGVLHIVKNYTGDVLNFELAAELADLEGIEVKAVVVDDDVAVHNSLYTAGRRGVAGTLVVEKVAGASAEEGAALGELVDLATRVNSVTRTMGMALTSCTVPAAGRPTFELADDEIELGIGIHGEPGRSRVPLAPAADLAQMLLDPVLEDLDYAGSEAIVIVNGMGGTPQIELYLLYAEVARILAAADVGIVRCLVGSYVTSLEMAGASVTLTKADPELLRLWDAPVDTTALRWGS